VLNSDAMRELNYQVKLDNNKEAVVTRNCFIEKRFI